LIRSQFEVDLSFKISLFFNFILKLIDFFVNKNYSIYPDVKNFNIRQIGTMMIEIIKTIVIRRFHAFTIPCIEEKNKSKKIKMRNNMFQVLKKTKK